MSRLRFRRKENKYTQIHNHIIFKNKNVELIGLYTIIQACIDLEVNTVGTENEFVITKAGIQSLTGYKRDKFQRIWDELKRSGYLKQYRITKDSGKFEYEYELLEEPDLTIHHSLIQKENGDIVPYVPKNKIEKLINKSNDIENVVNQPYTDFPYIGKMGGFNNNLLNKVCMYVEKTQKYFELREKDIELINSYKNNLSIDLFEELLLETINKNKSLNYFLSALKNTVSNNIKTLEEYETHKENFIANRSKSKKASNNSTKKEYSTTRKSDFEHKRTKFHNFDESFTQYSEDELDEIIERSQREKFGCR